jgi:7,8-dihydropterin-6-yl-methyl-4-(beta-D-ribofuranosyl)aminobenzene 5'-phosphate synthase
MERYLGGIPRRRLLRAAGGLGLLGGLWADAQAARAPALDGPPPTLDRVTVRVLSDSYFHQFEADATLPGAQVRRPRLATPGRLPKSLRGEWGLSLLVETARGDETRQTLIDFGYSADTLNHNVELLGLDPGRLDAMVLSHGHYDHFGGLAGFLATHGAKLKRGMPFHVGGEECFCTREVGPPASASPFGALDRRLLADAGLRLLLADRPSLVAGHGFTSGPIAQTSFEKPLPTSRMRPGIGSDGLGCAPEQLDADKRTLTLVNDDFRHEQATCFHLKGRGLVVLTSCGHRGIVNSVHAAMRASGIEQVHAVIGGFHLMPMPADYVRQTVAELKALSPQVVIPMHCSGQQFYDLARQELPGRVPLSSVGTAFVFEA